MVRKTLATMAALVIVALALPAAATNCTQSDGQAGWLDGTTADDAGCITADEYDQLYSIDNLVDAGVLTDVVDNGDGTATVSYALGGTGILIADPFDRPVAATPELEPDAPTVRQVLFPEYPATSVRLAAMVG
jgi:hypothetical protein